MVIGGLALVAIVVCAVVILLALGKITRQLVFMTDLLKTLDRRSSSRKATADHGLARIHEKLDTLERSINARKGSVDWQG